MVAVAGLWIERHGHLRSAPLAFLHLCRQAINGFGGLICRSSREQVATPIRNLAADEKPQPQRSHPLGTYERRELRMRW
jgi:hypothetical protein